MNNKIDMNSKSTFNPMEYEKINITREQIISKIQEVIHLYKIENQHYELKDILEQVCLRNDLKLSAKDKEDILNDIKLMKQAKCINGFSVEMCDGDGFKIENKYMTIEEGSIWDVEEEHFRVIGGEIRLTNEVYGWLEIPKEYFEMNFEIIG